MKITLNIIDLGHFITDLFIDQFKNDYMINLIVDSPITIEEKASITIFVDSKASRFDFFDQTHLAEFNTVPDIVLTYRQDKFVWFDKSVVLQVNASLLEIKRVLDLVKEKLIYFLKYKILLNKSKGMISSLRNSNNDLVSKNYRLANEKTDLEKVKDVYEEKHKAVTQELSLAGELQKGLLPKKFPCEDRIKFHTINLPCAYIGGDFYDVVQFDESSFATAIVDVAGHGIRSALIASMANAMYQRNLMDQFKTSKAATQINAEFCESIHSEEDYLTSFMMAVDLRDMTVNFCNAAHPYPFHIKKDGTINELKTGGFFIGMFPETDYEDETIQIESGDRIFMYTDGIIEIKGEEGEDFSRNRLKAYIKSHNDLECDELITELLQTLLFYSKEPLFNDDITMVMMEFL